MHAVPIPDINSELYFHSNLKNIFTVRLKYLNFLLVTVAAVAVPVPSRPWDGHGDQCEGSGEAHNPE